MRVAICLTYCRLSGQFTPLLQVDYFLSGDVGDSGIGAKLHPSPVFSSSTSSKPPYTEASTRLTVSAPCSGLGQWKELKRSHASVSVCMLEKLSEASPQKTDVR